MNEIEKQYCPICRNEVKVNERYPMYLCRECSTKTTDKDGRPVDFYNTTQLGTGRVAMYKDMPSEIYNSNLCYVNGVLCVAQEARFGGIVIQKK